MSKELFIISGPSGSGKQTLITGVLQRHPGIFHFTISMTSRPPRKGERDGIDYHFCTRERFEELIRQGAFLEWAEVHGNFYGTLQDEVVPDMRNLADIDVEGIRQVKALAGTESGLCVTTIFVAVRTIDTLRNRIMTRDPDVPTETVERRMRTATRELEAGPTVADHVIYNEDGEFDAALAHVERILFP